MDIARCPWPGGLALWVPGCGRRNRLSRLRLVRGDRDIGELLFGRCWLVSADADRRRTGGTGSPSRDGCRGERVGRVEVVRSGLHRYERLSDLGQLLPNRNRLAGGYRRRTRYWMGGE